MNKQLRVVGLVALTILVMGAAQAQEKYTLKLNLKKGQQFHQRMTINQEKTQETNGTKTSMTQETTMEYAYDVVDVDAQGVATIKATYQRFASKASALGKEVSFDSATAKPPIPPQFQPLMALIGKSFTMQVTPEGTVPSVTGVSDMLDETLKSLELDDASRTQLAATLKKQFGDDAMKAMMEQAMAIYPPHPVAIGDSWSKSITLSQTLPLAMDNTWTLKSVDDKTATLDVVSKIHPAAGGSTVDMGGAKIDMQMEGTQNGTTVIDRDSGWIASSNTEQVIDGMMVAPPFPGNPDGLKIPMHVKSTITMGPVG